MMAVPPNLASNKVYGVNLPQGLQREPAKVSENKFPIKRSWSSFRLMCLATFMYGSLQLSYIQS
jgi:hypothetical protein